MNNDKDSKTNGDVNTENQTIVEEKIVKATGDVQYRKYIKGRLLGKGGFAKCYEFTCMDTKEIHAAKVVAKSSLLKSRAKQKLISEIKIHKALHNTNIVGFERYFEDSENVYILLEMCHNQSLNDLLKRRKTLTEIEIQCYSTQMIKALKYLHSHRIIHRDLKLGNLFLTDKMELKVGDFGLATKLEFEGERKRTVCGTPNYIAPEILDGKTGHSYEVDIWSLGVIIYTLAIGKPPFETQDVKTTYKRIKMNSYSFPERAVISEACKALITDILCTDPLKRPSLDEIQNSEFFRLSVSIPKYLPTSTLACPPSLSYIKQFMPDAGPNGIVSKAVSTTTRGSETAKDNPSNMFGSKIMTERNKQLSQQFGQTNGTGFYTNDSRPVTTNFGSSGGKGYQPMTTLRDSTKNLPNAYSTDDKKGKTTPEMFGGNKLGTNNPQGAEIWVKKWVDYSSKYGLGYLLNNGFIGVFFNDSTKIIQNPKTLVFNYIERRQTDKQEIISQYTITDYPKDLQKKVTLMQHFKNYLEGENTSTSGAGMSNINTNGEMKTVTKTEDDNKSTDDFKKVTNYIYVKKWMKTKHAIMFRLSNKIVQVCFQDHTEIILSSESKIVTYVNKKAERLTYPLSTAMESNNNEMTKRLKYTKDILTHMLTLNSGATTGQQPGTTKGFEI
jgi:polo-like kinase 1